MSEEAGLDIAEDLLARSGRGLLTGEYEDFGGCFRLPLKLSTDLGSVEVLSHDQLKETFFRVRWHHRAIGMTRMVRKCLAAELLDDRTLICVHLTELFRGSELVQAPFKALSTVTRMDGDWKISECAYAIGGSLRYNRALYGARAAEKVDEVAAVPEPIAKMSELRR